jgi:PAS domain S-box-containing protein
VNSLFSGLKARLFLVVFLVWLPALLITLYTAAAEEQLLRRNAQTEALRLAQLVASSHEQVVRGTREVLIALSQLPSVRQPDQSLCRPLFTGLVENYASYTNLFLVDTDGRTYCSALTSDPSPEDVVQRSWFQRALEVQGFSQGDYSIGLVTKRPVVTFSYPIFDESGAIQYFIAASVDLAWVSEFIAGTELPAGITITAIDRNAIILYSYPADESVVGTPWPNEEFTNAVFSQGNGTIDSAGLDGKDYLFGFAPLVTTGSTYVLVGLPSQDVLAERNQILAQNILFLGGVGVLTLFVAWFGANKWLLKPLQALVSMAKQLSKGDLTVRVKVEAVQSKTEFDELGLVFNEMAQSLESHETALRESHDYLERQVQLRTAALSKSEEQMRLVTDSLPVLISYIDREKRYRFNNRTYEQWFGYAKDELLGKSMAEVLGEKAYQVLLPYVEQVLSGQLTRFESQIPYKNIGTRHVDAAYIPDIDEAREVVGFYVLIIDITERKRVELQNEALFAVTAAFSEALTLEQVADVFIQEGISAFGAHTAALFMLTSDGKALNLVSRTNLQEATRQRFSAVSINADMGSTVVVRTGEPLWFEDYEAYAQMFPDHAPVLKQHHSEAAAYLPLISRSRVIGSVGIGFLSPRTFDASTKAFISTLAKQCAQAVERAQLYELEAAGRTAAEQVSEARLKFLAMISHELRTPLTTIKGFSSTLLATDITLEPQLQQKFIGLIDEAADRLTDLIEQLLDLSRIQAGTLGIHVAEQSVAQIVNEAKAPLAAIQDCHEIIIEMAQDLPPVAADRYRIVQVIVNLVENAAKYSPKGTEIRLSIRREHEYIRFDVSDQGVGIPVEERQRVFQAFQQVERKEKAKGAGLGLAICKGLVEAHNGRIWVEEAPAGTTISFTLPIAINVSP